MKRTLWKQENYKEYPVMVNQEQKQYCDKRILEKIEDQFNYAEQGKSKVFFMRYDARFPQDDCEHADNHSFRSFQANFMKNLSRKGLKPQYVAVREQSREKHQHYHVCLWLDGNKTQSTHNHIQTAERLWRSQLGLPEGQGLIDDCTHSRTGTKQINGVMLRHDDPEYETKKADCFRRASYLAKIHTKGNTPKGQWEVFSSRIPEK